ncbi:hypothetical protein ES705_46841 [subsurface metagenome]
MIPKSEFRTIVSTILLSVTKWNNASLGSPASHRALQSLKAEKGSDEEDRKIVGILNKGIRAPNIETAG